MLIIALLCAGFPVYARGEIIVVNTENETEAAAASDYGDVVYRALLMANTYPGTTDELYAPDDDMMAMMKMLSRQVGTPYDITTKMNQTASQMLNSVNSVFGDADENDISLFYYSGHGTSSGELCGIGSSYVTISQLKASLDAIPGKKIILLDCCYSGKYIGRSLGSESAFNNAVISAFSVKARSNLATNNYIVLTACSQTETSYEFSDPATGNGYGFFTCGIAQGSGYDPILSANCDMYADQNADNNGRITLDEAYTYASDVVNGFAESAGVTQNIQYYGETDTVVWAYDENYVPDGMPTVTDYEYSIVDGAVTILRYTGSESYVLVPAKIDGYPVKNVADCCFYQNDIIETLVISEGISEITSNFAASCKNLKSISVSSSAKLVSPLAYLGTDSLVNDCKKLETIIVADDNPYLCAVDNVLYNKDMTKIICYPPQKPDAVFSVPDGIQCIASDAFADNNHLTEVILPDSVTSIGYFTFFACRSLEKVNIPENCTTIGQYAFQHTQLTNLHIPASLQYIVAPVFPQTLQTITVDENNSYFYAEDNVLFSTYNSGELVCYAAGKADEKYTVPSGIKVIEWSAFAGAANLKEVTLPDTVIEISILAFDGCTNLAKLVIPASVEKIADDMLDNKSTIIFGVEGSAAYLWANANGYAFRSLDSIWDVSGTCGDNIVWVLSENGVLTLTGTGEMSASDPAPWDTYALMITTANISDGITSIADKAFDGCKNLESISLPESLLTIGKYAFRDCGRLAGISLPSGITDIGISAFNGSGLEHIEIPASVETIRQDTFIYCENLTSVVIPVGVKYIHYSAFYSCTGLTSVMIPNGVVEIDDEAFAYCSNLESIVIPESVVDFGTDIFRNCSKLTVTVMPGSEAHTYCEENGIAFALVLPPEWAEDAIAWGSCGADVNWALSANGVLKLTGSGAMDDYDPYVDQPWVGVMDSIRHVVVEEGVASIGDRAFMGNLMIESITVASTVTSISANAFSGCSNVEKIIAYCSMGSSNYELRKLIQDDMVKIKTAGPIGSGCNYEFTCDTEVPSSAFTSLDTLEEVILPDNITAIGAGAFSHCASLRRMDLPRQLARIDRTAFFNCASLEEVVFQGDLPVIDSYAFLDTTATAIYPGNNATWTEQALKNYGGTLTWVSDVPLPTVTPTPVPTSTPTPTPTAAPTPTPVPDAEIIAAGVCGEDVHWKLDDAGLMTIYGSGPMSGSAETQVWAPYRLSVKAVVVEKGVTWIDAYAFSYFSALGRVELPDGITGVEIRAFANCTSLKEIVLPDQVASVGDYAFENCTALESVTLGASTVTLSITAFKGCTNLTHLVLRCPVDKDNFGFRNVAYNSGILSNFKSMGPIGSGCNLEFLCADTLPGNEFDSMPALQEVIIPDGAVTIAEYALWDNTVLKSVRFDGDAGTAAIQRYAFRNCASLEEIELPDTVTSIDILAFKDCKALSRVVFNCPLDLDGFTIRNIACNSGFETNIKTAGPIGSGCNLEFTCRDTLPGYEFNEMTSLEAVILPDTITSVGDNTFWSCTSLGEITFMGDPPKISSVAFSGVTATAFYPENNAAWTEQVMKNYGGSIAWQAGEARHIVVTLEGCAPTCTENGLADGEGCFICGEVLVEQEIIPALGHAEVIDAAVMPTCTETGLTEGKHCSVCSEVLAVQQVINALGHDEIIDTAVPATHITTGLTEGKHCSRCSKVLVPQETISMVEVPFKITLPKSLQVIEEQAFVDSTFVCVIVPDGCTSISAGAFAGNTSLMFIEIPASVKSIDATAFKNCSKDLVIITTDGSTAAIYAAEHSIYCVIK